MKKEWCIYLNNSGRCIFSGLDIPSMAEPDTLIEEVIEPLVTTDPNAIRNYLEMTGQYAMGIVLPEQLVVNFVSNKETNFLRCSASHSRGIQRRCTGNPVNSNQ